MSKLLKFIVVLALAFIVIFNCSYTFATVDMDLDDNITTSDTSSETSSTTHSSIVSTSEFDLELTNILCIVLIVVGVLLILLGIAILIRLQK